MAPSHVVLCTEALAAFRGLKLPQEALYDLRSQLEGALQMSPMRHRALQVVPRHKAPTSPGPAGHTLAGNARALAGP